MSEKTNLQFWNGFRFQLQSQLLTDSVLFRIACQLLFHFRINDTTTTNILQFAHYLWPFTYLTLRADVPSESSGFYEQLYVLHPKPFDIRSLLCSSCTQKNHFCSPLSWLVTRKSLTLWVVVIYNKQHHIQTI